MERYFSVAHTVAAVAAVVVGYFLILYFGTPIIEWAFNLYGRLFVPERFGGGSEVDNPGLITLLVRVFLLSGLSAWAAVAGAFKVFERAHARSVAIALALAVGAWAGYLLFLVPLEATLRAVMAVVSVFLMAAPPLIISYSLWADQSWS